MIESHGLILSLMSRMLSHDIRLQEKQQIFFFNILMFYCFKFIRDYVIHH